MTASQSSVSVRRLDPFIFPSDTDFRFVLLIVSVLGASLFIYKWLAPAGQQTAAAVQCLSARPVLSIQTNGLPAMEAFQQCEAPAAFVISTWMIGGTVLVLVVAALIYWFFPLWKIRRGQLVLLSSNDAPEVVAALVRLSGEAGLVYVPTFVWNPLNRGSSGLAFGRRGRYYVALTGDLVKQYYTDQPTFRAVILHELAHLRNADVDKTYFTVAVWWAFVIAALVPFTVTLLGSPIITQKGIPFKMVPILGWRALALAALVYLTRNAVLRAREVYADVRASTWDGAVGLGRVVATLPYPRGSWRRMLLVHPDPDTRLQAMQDTHRLFRLGFWEAFGLGIAAGIALPNVQVLLLFLGVVVGLPELSATTQTEIAVFFVTSMAVGATGLNIWRAAFAARTRSESLRGAGRIGLCLTIGLILGEVLSFERSVEDLIPASWAGIWARRLPWEILTLIALVLVMRWIAASASAWLDVTTPGRSFRLTYMGSLVIATVALALCLGTLFTLRDITAPLLILPNTSQLVREYIYSSVVNAFKEPITLFMVVSLWAFPLAAGLWRKQGTTGQGIGWSFLAPSQEEFRLPQEASLRPQLALCVGLISGLAFCGLLLVIRVVVHFGLSEATRSTNSFRSTFVHARVWLAALIQAGAAARVACWVKRLSLVHSLFAEFTAACVMTVGMLGIELLFGNSIDASYSWLILSESVTWGWLASVLVVGAMAALTRLGASRSVPINPL